MENGRGTVQLQIPQFNGTLRLMAVAFAGGDYGGTEAYLTVREPIVLTPTFPRFLAGGDKVRVPVTLFNGTGTEGVIQGRIESIRATYDSFQQWRIAISHRLPSVISKSTSLLQVNSR